LGAGTGHHQRDRLADAAAGAGDQNDLVMQIKKLRRVHLAPPPTSFLSLDYSQSLGILRKGEQQGVWRKMRDRGGGPKRRAWTAALLTLGLLFGVCPPHPARADVERIEILERALLADGKSFGNVGPYERLRGRLYFAVEPAAPENQPIVDIRLAPR